MRYQLLGPIVEGNSTIETILLNRGISKEEAYHYLNTTDEDINDFRLLGEHNLDRAQKILHQVMARDANCMIVVDADCDGFTSSALLANYLHDMNPEWVENHVTYFMHEGKQHGLADVVVSDDISLVFVPDAGSNDYGAHKELRTRNIDVIVLDHHEAEKESTDAIVINNQMSDYPNKDLSGVGVTWQFCRYLDCVYKQSFANAYLDLVALGLDADMMSLKSLETKHLINKGLELPRVVNPFFFEMKKKNAFSIGPELTPIAVAFYVAPYVNSMVRSGNQEEKMLLFKSMLKHEAFKRVPSTKRGHKAGEEERIVDQAIRVANNVKSRQTKSQNSGLEIFEKMIEDKCLLDNKVLLFLCPAGSVPPNIAGLIANKFQAKYQRNTAILFKKIEKDGSIIWRGSARGYSKSIIESFKDLCEETGVVEYAQGHAGAFGLGIKDENVQAFLQYTNDVLASDTGEATYHVDYIYNGTNVNSHDILTISQLNNLWGQDMPEALVAIKGLKVTSDMVTLMSPDKRPTIKIQLFGGACLIKFGSSQEEYQTLISQNGYIEIDSVGSCSANEWNGNVTPQILVKDFEITGSSKYLF